MNWLNDLFRIDPPKCDTCKRTAKYQCGNQKLCQWCLNKQEREFNAQFNNEAIEWDEEEE